MPKLPIRKAVEVSFRVKLMAITRFTKTKSKIITGICVKNKKNNHENIWKIYFNCGFCARLYALIKIKGCRIFLTALKFFIPLFLQRP